MTAEHARALIQLIGLWTQLGATALLVALFVVMRRHGPRRTYFSTWGEGWGALCAAVAALLVETFYRMAPPDLIADTGGPDSPIVRSLFLLHVFGRLLFLALILAGTTIYTRGLNHVVYFRIVATLAAVWAAAAVLFGGGLDGIMLWQVPVAVVAYGLCAWRLGTLPPSRSGVGTAMTASAFLALAVVWALSGVALRMQGGEAAGSFWEWLTVYHTYLDLLLLMLLGFGMLVIQLEDARREVDDARAELSVTNDSLRRMALYDTLTGCLNRRAFADGIGLEVAKSTFGTAVMLDMDNLKWVNDHYGHGVGDELLTYFARVLREHIRPLDRLYRWGGDEFLLILPGATVDGVQGRLSALMDNAPPLPMDAAHGADKVILQISLGAESYANGDALTAAIERADATMYTQKRARKRTMTPQNVPLVS
ncbi:MAG: GGDEF domain-containing protein [Gemmatimonadetes bacterium]|nr:GGDEF domain-containing protein [Gemmatimonadota bacterium]